jgi:hypothetical protein
MDILRYVYIDVDMSIIKVSVKINHLQVYMPNWKLAYEVQGVLL